MNGIKTEIEFELLYYCKFRIGDRVFIDDQGWCTVSDIRCIYTLRPRTLTYEIQVKADSAPHGGNDIYWPEEKFRNLILEWKRGGEILK